jgi:hypothetical protein
MITEIEWPPLTATEVKKHFEVTGKWQAAGGAALAHLALVFTL